MTIKIQFTDRTYRVYNDVEAISGSKTNANGSATYDGNILLYKNNCLLAIIGERSIKTLDIE